MLELKNGYRFVWWILAVLFVITSGIGIYLYQARRYTTAYLPHTSINGLDVSGKTVQEVQDLIRQEIKEYRLTLLLRAEKSEEINGSDIGLHAVFDGTLEALIGQQNPYAWPVHVWKGESYEMQALVQYDETRMQQQLKALSCMKPENMKAPEDAILSDYISGTGYAIVPEMPGSSLDEKRVMDAVREAIGELRESVDLEAADCYRLPGIRTDDTALLSLMERMNRYVHTTVTYQFGSRSEILNGDIICEWLVVDGNQVSLDEELLAAYVKELGRKYNTAYTKRNFLTSYGEEVTVSGFYGWRIDQEQEREALRTILEEGKSVEREPIYAQQGASHGGNDYGDTYAEVNLTAQHMFFYKDGEKILESDFVSGSVARGYETPPGIFGLTYKQRDTVLKGQGYASPVKFWMPFNGGIGFHDASWRNRFGGTIYRTNGSHGCVNMPHDAAEILYEHVYANMPVICYELPGTESGKADKSNKKETQPEPETVNEINQPATGEAEPEVEVSQPATEETGAAPEIPAVGEMQQTTEEISQPEAALEGAMPLPE